MPNRFPFNTPNHPEDNWSINKAFDRNYGNRLKSGDTTTLKYTIKDGDGEPLDKERLPNMQTSLILKYEGVTAYKTEFEATLEEVTENYVGDLVARFRIDEALPPSDTPYVVEFHFEDDEDLFIFPSVNTLELYITPSSLNSDGEAIKNASEQRLNEIVERKLDENPVLSEAEAKELARQENYQELLDTGVMQTKINERLEDLEEEYAPKLTEVTARLAQTQTNLDTKKADKEYVENVLQNLASGSPKGTFATVEDLTQHHPSGNDNIYVVTSDGNWYYWNDNAWEPGGVYQSSIDVSRLANDLKKQSPLINEIPNSNFENTNGWSTSNTATLSTSNNKLIITTNGNSQYPFARTPKIIDSAHEKRLFFKARIRVTNDVATSISGDVIYTNGVEFPESDKSGTWKINDPVKDQWYDLHFVATLRNTYEGFDSGVIVRFLHLYDEVTSGNSLEVSDLLVVDITNLALVGKEPAEVEMNKLINRLPDSSFTDKANIGDLLKIVRHDAILGANKVEDIKLEYGKNRFNRETGYTDHFLYSAGILLPSAGWTTSDFIEVPSDTDISINRMRFVVEYDALMRYISRRDGGVSSPPYSFKTNEKTKFIRVTTLNESVDTLQVELGDLNTPYEPYKTPIIRRFNGDSVRTDESLDEGKVEEMEQTISALFNNYSSLENLVRAAVDENISVVLNSEIVSTDMASKLNALETEYAPRLTQNEIQALAPKLKVTQAIHRGGIKNSFGEGSDYVVFKDIYLVFDVTLGNSGATYALAEHVANGAKQGVYKSIDGGETWSKMGDLNIDAANGVWYTQIFVEPNQETFYLLKTNNGHSETNNDVVSFSFSNGSFSQIGSLHIGRNRWLSSDHSIEAKASRDFTKRIVMFAEYGTSLEQPTFSVWKTTDRGVSWVKALELNGDGVTGIPASGEIRHFHCIQADSYTGDWWLGSGDADPQCKIFRSQDEGDTWELMWEGTQRERTTSFVFERDYIYYGMDSTSHDVNGTKIVRVDKNDMSRKDVATVDMGYAIYTLTKTTYPEGFLVWTCYENSTASVQSDRIIVEFYDYLTEKLYPVAYFNTKGLDPNAYAGFQGASRIQDRISGNVFALPTPNMQQGKYGYSSVSRYIKADITT